MSKQERLQKTEQQGITISEFALRLLITGAAIIAIVFKYKYLHDADNTFNRDELILLGIATVPWLARYIKNLKVTPTGVEVSAQELNEVKIIANAAFDAGKNPRKQARKLSKAIVDITKSDALQENLSFDAHSDDPTFKRFGHNPEKNNRKLEPKIESIPGRDFYRRVVLQVKSTDTKNKLEGRVRFFLHPSFDTPEFEVPAREGVARTSIVSYGAFTVGAIVADGKTKTELGYDLTQYPHNTDDEWYLR
jgi:hypothetical protein